jgi:hypothetical protein
MPTTVYGLTVLADDIQRNELIIFVSTSLSAYKCPVEQMVTIAALTAGQALVGAILHKGQTLGIV